MSTAARSRLPRTVGAGTWKRWSLLSTLGRGVLLRVALLVAVSGSPAQQQQVDEWCGQRFGSDRKSCEDLLSRWCLQSRVNSNDGQSVPGICQAYKGSTGGGNGLPQPAPQPQATPQRVPQPQPQQSQSDMASSGGPKTQKADPNLLGSVNELFNKLAEGKRLAEEAVKTFSDPLRAAAASPLWPMRQKDTKSKASVTELTMNDPSKYYHGDIDLSRSQANWLIEWAKAQDSQSKFESSGRGRKKRKVGSPPAFELWSINPIPYQFHRSVPVSTRALIKQAINMWEANTCRKWKEGGLGQERIEFVDGDGCSSYIGHAGGTQEISLHTPGCDLAGIAAHEIGHSLGFFHEQSRPDQGDNIQVNYKNIRASVKSNFVPMKEKNVNYYSEPYDFGSVMHYDGLTRGFTFNDNEHSILTLDPHYQNTIGQRVTPSFVDFKQINLAYCSGACGGLNSHGCQFGGYADPNKCDQCKCPNGFGGSKCEGVQQSTIPNCGGVLQATKDPQFFTSPNYPRAFPTNGACYWQLKAPDPKSRVYIEFVEKFSFPCEDTCASSYVELKRGPAFERTGYRFCCDSPPDGQPLISEGPLMVMMLNTFGAATSGFKVRYYSDAGTGTVPPPVATPRPGGGTRRPLPPPAHKPSPGGWTPPPGPAPTQPPGCNCDEWGRWSGCSQSCGGCGYIRRQRQCNKKDCFDIEKKHCNFRRCKDGTNLTWRNNEVNFLFEGCCIGMVANGNTCGGLSSAFTQLISSFLPTGNGRR